jgi:hypothetical protein
MAFLKIDQPAAVGPIVWTVPVNTTWQIIVGHVILTTSATGGNRWLTFTVKDESGNKVWDAHAGLKQGSSVAREYRFSLGGSVRETAFIDDDLIIPLPRIAILQENWTMTLQDSDAIDNANDTFEAHGLIHTMKTNNPRPDQLI